MNRDTNMLYSQEEQEYQEFMAKLFQKGLEVNHDFQKLSPENRKRVNDAIGKIVDFHALNQRISKQ